METYKEPFKERDDQIKTLTESLKYSKQLEQAATKRADECETKFEKIEEDHKELKR